VKGGVPTWVDGRMNECASGKSMAECRVLQAAKMYKTG
jgi:hypothetical protein